MAEKNGIGEKVELGFAEECEDPDDFSSNNFPSKTGGKPVWLDPVSLPPLDSLTCKECKKPCLLLLQVYAPHSDDPANFHRTIYIFMCTDPNCCKPGSSKSFRVLRCQLPKQNPYYDDEVDDDNDKSNTEELQSIHNSTEIQTECTVTPSFPVLCTVCGSPGPNRCGQCLSSHYCSQHHQVIDWKNGHKRICKDLKSGIIVPVGTNSILLPELQIITETEPENQPLRNDKTEKQRLQEYQQYIDSDTYNKGCINDTDQLDLIQNSKETDKIFESFKKRIAIEPEQIIRFQPGGQPLLITHHNTPSNIPQCEGCGGNRQFEFQVMPQLLYYLRMDSTATPNSTITTSIDWGTLLIYSCVNNCNLLPGYREEFLWKQDLI